MRLLSEMLDKCKTQRHVIEAEVEMKLKRLKRGQIHFRSRKIKSKCHNVFGNSPLCHFVLR